jgi:hypothetical protein
MFSQGQATVFALYYFIPQTKTAQLFQYNTFKFLFGSYWRDRVSGIKKGKGEIHFLIPTKVINSFISI